MTIYRTTDKNITMDKRYYSLKKQRFYMWDYPTNSITANKLCTETTKSEEKKHNRWCI